MINENEQKEQSQVMKYFCYSHLPPKLQNVSKRFGELAEYVDELPACPQKFVALQKLLEAKDAAVRAALE